METAFDSPAIEARFRSQRDLRPLLREALRRTEESVEGLNDVPYEQVRALDFAAGWGPRFDPETMLEHGIVHLPRHRRQLERWSLTPEAPPRS